MITRGFNSKYACIRHKTRGIGRCPLCTMPSQRGPIVAPEKPVEISVNTRSPESDETGVEQFRRAQANRRKLEKSHTLLMMVFDDQAVRDTMSNRLFKLIQEHLKEL